MRAAVLRPLVGLVGTGVLVGLVALSVTLFHGGFTDTVPVTVLSQRAGLVMDPGAKVMLHGVQVGTVSSIDERADGRAAIRLAIESTRLSVIPDNVAVDIASSTVFGAKAIQLVPPDDASAESLRPGQVIDAGHVMLETDTLFEQLVSVLSTVEPDKLNETLGAIAAAFRGRGQQLGQALSNANAVLSQFNSHAEALDRDVAAAPVVVASYADAIPHLLSIADSATEISRIIVDRQHDLDALLVSAVGLGDLGNDVLSRNAPALADVLHLLVPTTSLTNEYNAALTCGLGGIDRMANNAPLNAPGVEVLAGFMWGQDRYRYPADLPKVAARGGPQCTDLPRAPYGKAPPFVVSDTGANPWKYANPGVVLNSDLLKQILFGPIPGPPRNSAQIGQPG